MAVTLLVLTEIHGCVQIFFRFGFGFQLFEKDVYLPAGLSKIRGRPNLNKDEANPEI